MLPQFVHLGAPGRLAIGGKRDRCEVIRTNDLRPNRHLAEDFRLGSADVISLLTRVLTIWQATARFTAGDGGKLVSAPKSRSAVRGQVRETCCVNQATLTLLMVLTVFGICAWYGWQKHSKQSLYNDLLRKCFGDAAQAERLIEAERKRYPSATRERLIRHAIDRWRQHNRS